MITIAGRPSEPASLVDEFPADGVERKIIEQMAASSTDYRFASAKELWFELSLRREIIDASNALNRSGLRFAIFRKAECNTDFWELTPEGGFKQRADVKASDAVRDIFKNGRKYATECATGMVIVYLGALLNLFGDEKFNQHFNGIYLMNWHNLPRNIREIGWMNKEPDYFPGDRRYFANPDVDPVTPEWQGENVIDLSGGLYYGHGMGKRKADEIIAALNRRRKPDATRSAYLMDSAGRPNFKRLASLYYGGGQ